MNFLKIFFTILCLLLGTKNSHPQYYSPYRLHNDYDFEYQDEDLSAAGTSDYYNRRGIESSTRHQPRHYTQQNYFQEARSRSPVPYSGMLGNIAPAAAPSKQTKVTTENKDIEVLTTSQQPSASVALYRIRYNNNPTTPPPPEPQPPYYPERELEYSPPNTFYRNVLPTPRAPPYDPEPPPRGPPSFQRGIGIFLNDDGGTRIYISSPEKPNDRPEVFHINRNNPPPPSFSSSSVGRPRPPSQFENDQTNNRGREEVEVVDERRGRPPYAVVVIMDNRPRQFCYNETYRYYRPNGRCYIPGATSNKSPCGPLMLFYPEEDNSNFGDCDCLINNGKVSRPLAYWRPHDRCYLLYQRGPCLYNEWLVMNKTGYPLCAPRRCPHGYDEENEESQEFWFLHKGKCFRTGEYHPSICSVGQEERRVYFPLGSSKPACLTSPPNPKDRTLLTPVVPLRCKKGYKKMQNGDCKRTVQFGYDYDDYDYK